MLLALLTVSPKRYIRRIFSRFMQFLQLYIQLLERIHWQKFFDFHIYSSNSHKFKKFEHTLCVKNNFQKSRFC